MDKFKAMQTFVAIVERGSLTAAAEALATSVTAVVRTLAALEAHLGVRLLNRTTRRQALTEEGRHYLASARSVLAELDEAERALGLQHRQEVPSGTLSVTAPVMFGQCHVAPAVTGFLQKYPQVRCKLLLLDRVVNLVEEGLDVGFRIGELQDSRVVAQSVGQVRRIVVASPAFLRRHGVLRHPRELAGQPCLYTSLTGNLWRFREGSRTLAVTVQGPLECSLMAPMLEACASGLGFGRCLSYQAAPLLRAKKLRIVLADHEPAPWPVQITYPSARMLPLRSRLFIDWMKQALQDSSATWTP
jgi:DNA-binding transcriptional LysR family regulator